MTLRIPLHLTLVLLLSLSATAFAQDEQPPLPPTPPQQPAAAPAPPAEAPEAPMAPMAFSFFFDSESFLGIYPEEVNTGNMRQYAMSAPRGVAVGRVVEGSPAERAGLRKDDVILRFNGEEVTSARKLNRLISEVAPDHTARLTISRGGVEQEITVTLSKRENFPRSFGTRTPRAGDLDRPGQDLGDLRNIPDRNDFSFVFGANRRIGIGVSALTKQLADYFGVRDGRGVLVTSVNENGPAQKAGLKAGDVITAIEGSRVERVSDLMRELNRKESGEVTLTVIRDKSQRTFKLTPERGQAFDFGPEIEFAPQVGQLVIPHIAIPAMPAIPAIRFQSMPKIVLPKMVLPAMPEITIPKIKAISIPYPL
jgi:serine protease Do